MDYLFSDYIDLLLLPAIAVALFDGIRHLVIYGPGRRSFWTLFFCAVAVVAGALIFDSKSTRESSPVPAVRPKSVTAYPHGTPEDEARMKEKAEKSYAQFSFVQKGEILDYTGVSGAHLRYEPSPKDFAARAELLADKAGREAQARLYQMKARVWGLFWIPLVLIAFVQGRMELRKLVEECRFNRVRKPQTYAEVEGFVGMLKAACSDPEMNSTLELILAQPDEGRQTMIRELLGQFREKRAPQLLTDAFVCLLDDEVAEKVYVFIHKCERPLAAAA